MGRETTMELIDFIARSPSPFHAVEQVRQALEAAGYRPLQESEPWDIAPGDRCYVKRNGSSLIAFRVPRESWRGFLLSASHSDSPTFQIKEHGELEGPEGYLRLNTERYGGMLCVHLKGGYEEMAKFADATTIPPVATSLGDVVTLEGGFTAWTETYPDNVEP